MTETIFEHDYILETLQTEHSVDRKYICPYCGQPLKSKTISDRYDDTTYMFCDCEDAKKAIEIIKKIKDLKFQMPRKKFSYTASDNSVLKVESI